MLKGRLASTAPWILLAVALLGFLIYVRFADWEWNNFSDWDDWMMTLAIGFWIYWIGWLDYLSPFLARQRKTSRRAQLLVFCHSCGAKLAERHDYLLSKHVRCQNCDAEIDLKRLQ